MVVLGLLRAATLLQGAIAISGSARSSRSISAWLLGALACAAAVVFTNAGRRLGTSGEARWPFGEVSIAVEVTSGTAALFVLASVTPAAGRLGPDFWALPYTVISVVIMAASASPWWVGAFGALSLAAGYLATVLTGLAGPPSANSASIGAAYSNAVSYLVFYALALMGFRLLRGIAGQAELLRLELARLSEKRARHAVADRITQVAHDHAKALLREVPDAGADMPASRLREQAPRFRDRLLKELASDPRAPINLHAELIDIANIYVNPIPIKINLDTMDTLPPGTPTRAIAGAVRELLNNACWHGYGYPVELSGSASATALEICVRNGVCRGRGVDPQDLKAKWARKRNSIQRFKEAGGDYEIVSSPDSDEVAVILRFPCSTASGRTAP